MDSFETKIDDYSDYPVLIGEFCVVVTIIFSPRVSEYLTDFEEIIFKLSIQNMLDEVREILKDKYLFILYKRQGSPKSIDDIIAYIVENNGLQVLYNRDF